MTKAPKLIREDQVAEMKSLRLHGFIQSTYERMVAVFGVPSSKPVDRKMAICWTLEFSNGDIAQIYCRDTVINGALTCVFRIASQNRDSVQKIHDLYRKHHQLGRHRELHSVS